MPFVRCAACAILTGFLPDRPRRRLGPVFCDSCRLDWDRARRRYLRRRVGWALATSIGLAMLLLSWLLANGP